MRIFQRRFEDLTEEEIELTDAYFKGYDYRGAGYTFLGNYIWRDNYNLYAEIIGKYMVVASVSEDEGDKHGAIIAMPLTKDGTYEPDALRATILECKRRFDENEMEFVLVLVPGHLVRYLKEAFGDELVFIHDRDADEYVYLKEKLISLSGRQLHKKKNHLNYFLKNVEYEVRPVTADMESEIMALTTECDKAKDDTDGEESESLRKEKDAIRRILEHIQQDDVYSSAIYIDGKLQAFAIGERLSEEMACEHFEKAADIRGLYQAICREFCKSLPEEITLVNREEDMGIENLRQAKEALRPEYMETRYVVKFANKTI